MDDSMEFEMEVQITYRIGNSLAKQYPSLKPAHRAMLDFHIYYQSKLDGMGISMQPTNDQNDLDTIRMQWEMLTNDIPEAKEIYKLIPESI